MVTTESDALIERIAEGQAVLLLGQRHTPGLSEKLAADFAAITGMAKHGSFVEQVLELGSLETLGPARRALLRYTPSDELSIVASCPWALVLLSAVDPISTVALSEPSSNRRLRLLYANRQTPPISASRNPAALTVVRLFGSVEEDDRELIPPLTSSALRQRRAFNAAPVLQQLPYVVGNGCLVVAGVGDDDWIDLQTLSLACADLPPRTVHWFPSPEAEVDLATYPDFGNSLVTYSVSLAQLISGSSGTHAGNNLQFARQKLVSPDDRIITHGRRGARHRIILAPHEWRNATQAVSVLDDLVADAPPPLETDELRDAFRKFLRGGQRPPDWQGVVRGFLFRRDCAEDLFRHVHQQITKPRAVNPSGGSTILTSRRPLLLVAHPVAGKPAYSIGLR